MKRFLVCLLCLSLLCPPVYGTQRKKLVALTFDDGPSGRFTRALLKGLAQRDVKATFLLCGYRMEQYPQLTQQIHDAGHEIGLHGFTHKAMDRMTQAEIQQEITKSMALIPKGCTIRFLRPPGGQSGAAAQAATKAAGLSLLCWSVDPRDWNTHDAAAIEHQVLCQVQDGDIILLHDMSDSSVDAALAIVDRLKAKGYRFVTASELARLQGVTPVPGVLYNRFS